MNPPETQPAPFYFFTISLTGISDSANGSDGNTAAAAAAAVLAAR